MELTGNESARLDLIRFPLIVGVIFGHAYESLIQFSGTVATLDPSSFAAMFIRYYIGKGLAFVAVPLFFFMSGYLFFYRLEWSGPAFKKKVQSRVFTLLIPFLFWNILYLGLYAIAQELPITAQYLSGGVPRITELSIGGYFNMIFGVTRSPIAFQFWFIRDLMVMVVLTPLFHLMHKKTSISLVFLFIFFIVWFFNKLSIIPDPQSVFFFFAGSILAVQKKSIFWLDRYGLVILAICLVLFTMDTLFHEHSFGYMLHRAAIATGVFAGLYASRVLLYKKVEPLFMWLGSVSFFIFAFHEPLQGFIQRVIIKLYTPTDDLTKLLYFFAIPLLVIAISLVVIKLLSSTLPRYTAIITGQRMVRLKKAEP